jgi:hypothetical protein
MQERAAELLPVEYFHVVFTLPEQLSALALQNKRVIYDLLFRAASQTLLEIAADPKRLGAAIGFLAVLHTWGQTLQHHPHVHCVIPGGGLSPDHSRWVSCRKDSFSLSKCSVGCSAGSLLLISGLQTSKAVSSFTVNRNIWRKVITFRVY